MKAPTRRGLLGDAVVLAAAPVTPAIATRAAPHPDTELLRLGTLLVGAIAIENAAWAVVDSLQPNVDDDWPEYIEAHAKMAAVGEIAEHIGAVQATTFEGVMVKVRAVVWCRSGDTFNPADIELGMGEGPSSTHAQILASMLTDLAAMGRSGA